MIRSTHGILSGSGRDNLSGYLFKDTGDTADHTGTVSNTLVYSHLIPANTMQVGDFFRFNLLATKTGTAGTNAIRTYFNTSASLSGATQFSLYTSTSTIIAARKARLGFVKSSTVTEVLLATSSVIKRDSFANSVPSSLNIDWTVDQYFIVAFQLSNVADIANLRGVLFLKS